MRARIFALAIAGSLAAAGVAIPTETPAISDIDNSDGLVCCAGLLCDPNQGITVRLTAFRGNDEGSGTVQIGNIVHDADFVEGGIGGAELHWRWKDGHAVIRWTPRGFAGSYQVVHKVTGQVLSSSLHCKDAGAGR